MDGDSSNINNELINDEKIAEKRIDDQDQPFPDSELVIGLVGAVGTEIKRVVSEIIERLSAFNYQSREIRISQEIIPFLSKINATDSQNEYKRIDSYMTAGNEARRNSQDNSILAMGAVAKICEERPDKPDEKPYKPRLAYIINSLKHPEEVEKLRKIYTEGFYLIGIFSDRKTRLQYLTEDKKIKNEDAEILMKRDEDEHLLYGQRVRDTFHLSDFFIYIDDNSKKMKKSIWRILDILFGHPYKTPTFDEYAMFMAYSASIRSADLSRQVGAVLAQNKEIIATGANDCPQYGGGLYWPHYDVEENDIIDDEEGRDYKRKKDSNKIEKEKIISEIVSKFETKTQDQILITDLRDILKTSPLDDITEYGRVVHAEMEALLSCARNNISARGGTLYCTTFPCHNCAKHIIAAGIRRVVYIEPYQKSKAIEFHDDAIRLGFVKLANKNRTVQFEPFVGVGPRRFLDLFSMRLGAGYPLKRKDDKGHTILWDSKTSKLRIQMLPFSYIEKETLATSMFNTFFRSITNSEGKKP